MMPGAVAIPWDAIVVAGGESRRMGADKLGLDVEGMTLFDRVLHALDGAHRLVVVGPQRPTRRDVVWCREEPVGGGPAAALGAGIGHIGSDYVVVMAADQPFVDRDVVATVLFGIGDHDGAVVVDDEGHPQWLCSAWRADAIRRAAPGPDVSLRDTIGRLRWQPVRVDASATLDCDTPDDLRRARELARRREPVR